MSLSTLLNNISSKLFLAGFVIAKFRLIPIPLFNLVIYILSLICYFAGYMLSFIAHILEPDDTTAPTAWYQLIQIKTKSKISAFFGLIAIISCFVAFAFPPLTICSLWLFIISNLFWCFSEYRKINHPPEQGYPAARRKTYLIYAVITTCSSIVVGVLATIALLIPPAAIIISTISTICAIILSLAAMQYWFDYQFYPKIDEHEKPVSTSHQALNQQLGGNKYRLNLEHQHTEKKEFYNSRKNTVNHNPPCSLQPTAPQPS